MLTRQEISKQHRYQQIASKLKLINYIYLGLIIPFSLIIFLLKFNQIVIVPAGFITNLILMIVAVIINTVLFIIHFSKFSKQDFITNKCILISDNPDNYFASPYSNIKYHYKINDVKYALCCFRRLKRGLMIVANCLLTILIALIFSFINGNQINPLMISNLVLIPTIFLFTIINHCLYIRKYGI